MLQNFNKVVRIFASFCNRNSWLNCTSCILQQQVSNAARSHFEIVVRDPVKHGDNSMSVRTCSLPQLRKLLAERVGNMERLPKKLESIICYSILNHLSISRFASWEYDSLTYCASGGVYRLTSLTKYVQTQASRSTRTSSRRSSGGFGILLGCTQGCKSRIEVRWFVSMSRSATS